MATATQVVDGPTLRHPSQNQRFSDSPPLVECQPLPVRRLALDVTLGVLCFSIEVIMRIVEPVQRGFYCDDLDIRYPYIESTISTKALFIYVFSLPALIIILVECLRFTLPKTKNERYSVYEYGRKGLRRFGVRFFSLYGYALLGVSITMLVNTLAKFFVGRLRPHFLAVCRPMNVDLTTCNGVHNEYIMGVQCDWLHPSAIVESRLSFFSGHASLSMCAAFYSVVYLQYRVWPLIRFHASRAPLAILQLVILSSASFIGYSRIFDYWHHWSDVLCGMIVGAAIGFLMGLFLVLPQNHLSKLEFGVVGNDDANDESGDVEARTTTTTRIQQGRQQHFV